MTKIKKFTILGVLALLISAVAIASLPSAFAAPVPFTKFSSDAWDAEHTNGNLVGLHAIGGGIYTHYGNNNGVATAFNKPFNSDAITDIMDPNVSANAGKITVVNPGIYQMGDMVAFEDPDGAQIWHNDEGVWTQFNGWTVNPSIDRIDNILVSGGSDTCVTAGDLVFCQDESNDPFVQVSNAGIDFGSNEGRPYAFMENNLEYAQGRLVRTTVTDMGGGIFRSSIWSKNGLNDWADITPNLLVGGDIIFDMNYYEDGTTIFVIYNTELDSIRTIASTDALFTGWTQIGGTNLDLGDIDFNPFGNIFNDNNNGGFFVSAQDSDGHGRLVIYNPDEDVWEEITNPDFENDGSEPESVAVTGQMFEGSMRFGTATLGSNDATTNGKIYTGSSVIPSNNTTTTTVATTTTAPSETTVPGGSGNGGTVTPGNPNGHPANTVTPEIEDDGPNGGDANGDGTPDSDQENVSSFVNPETGDYAVMEAPVVCSNETTIIEAEPIDYNDVFYQYPAGLMNFTIECNGTVGGTSTVKLIFYGLDQDANDFLGRKFINNDYKTLTGSSLVDEAIGGRPAVSLTYSLADGGPLDVDGQANGRITDPAGVGTTQGALPDTGTEVMDVLPIAALMIVAGAGIAFAVRRRKLLA